MSLSYIFREMLRPFYLLVGIFLVSISPMFTSVSGLQWPGFQAIGEVLQKIMSPGSLIYTNPTSGVERDLFPIIFKPFWSSMSVIGIALIVSLTSALFLSILLRFVSGRLYKGIMSIASIFQTIPDVVYVLVSQMFLVWVYIQTGVKFAKFTGTGTEEALLLPGVVLSLLPFIYFLKTILAMIKDEEGEPYVDLAASKGLHKLRIVCVHMLRNLLVRLAYQSKFIISLMISNLLIVEYLFNNFGMTVFLLNYTQPPVFFVTAILFFFPIYVGLKMIEGLLYLMTQQEVSL
ncbi:ABC transporter permease subunit [Halobacillus sp. Nhm2S1]|uniref:ABC transporter permease subunit n=1 Tax=Halobacillus sp. Nhm2S1 TaxID=2866716 RepID=UPI001C72A371|nr:ABC transporter permease subunit [Halobacillus sp. Nhm2S1]MBX0359499.1 ABC transporter permease subunit [Halobacillus sp. Nhm2S1]